MVDEGGNWMLAHWTGRLAPGLLEPEMEPGNRVCGGEGVGVCVCVYFKEMSTLPGSTRIVLRENWPTF